MYVIYLMAAAVIATAIHTLVWGAQVVPALLMWLLVFKVGLGGIWTFLGHYFKSDEIAGYIGWPAGNPFQKEVAFANLSTGVCGVLCFFIRGDFWLATIIASSVFLLGAFSVHVKSQKETGNKAPGNAGPVFFADIIAPLAMWALYIIMRVSV